MALQVSLQYDCFTFLTDESGVFTSLSPGVFHVLGYLPEELIGRSFTGIIASGEVQKSMFVHTLLTGAQPFNSLEITLARKDGPVIETEVSGLPAADIGLARGCHGIVQAASGRQLTADETAPSVSQAELFLDLVCHDLNNMIQIEAGYLELARQSPDTGSEAGAYIERCLSVLGSSSSLIHNVQKLQQISTGPGTLETVDLGHILGDAVRAYEAAHDGDVVINYKPVHQCYVLANGLLKEVFLNIIGNAIKHSTGPPVIDVRVKETFESGKRYCIVAIEDNGPGIPDDLKARLFNRFQSGRTPTSGKGLGLYLVRKLIEGYHGNVYVEDRVPGDFSQGSRFVIMLPAADNQKHYLR
jgi:PAS domain S-box-containing protein